MPAYASTVGDFNLALADGGDPQEGVDCTWTDDNTQGGVLAILSEAPMVIANADGVEVAKDQIVVDPGLGESAAVALSGIVIEYPDDNRSCGIEIASGDCAIILADDSENEVSRGGALRCWSMPAHR